jgi:hypothetical protein
LVKPLVRFQFRQPLTSGDNRLRGSHMTASSTASFLALNPLWGLWGGIAIATALCARRVRLGLTGSITLKISDRVHSGRTL